MTGSGSSGGSLLNIPVDLLLEIFRKLDHLSILHCRTVCQCFNQIIQESVELTYIVQLALDGVLPGQTCTVSSYRDQLEALLIRRRRWNRLEWTGKTYVSSPEPYRAYELVGGVFAKAEGSKLTAQWLPSSQCTDMDPLRVPITVNMNQEMDITDFAMDPSQDLIAYLHYEVDGMDLNHPTRMTLRFRTLSSDAQHPEACNSVFVDELALSLGSAQIQIVDDVVGLFLRFRNFWNNMLFTRLQIWNWKTARELVSKFDQHITTDIDSCSFSFISSTAYILTSCKNMGEISIHTFSSTSAPQRTATPVVKLRLPEVNDNAAPTSLITHTAPFLARRSRERPFVASPDSQIHVMFVNYPATQHFVVVHNSVFLAYAQTIETGTSDSQNVSWDDWGPSNTRFFPNSFYPEWLRYVHGQQLVLPPSAGHAENVLIMLDFNPHRKCEDTDLIVQHYHRNTSTYVASGDTFKAPRGIITNLPYHCIARRVDGRYSAYMIDDERIVAVEADTMGFEHSLENLQVLSF